MTRSGVGLLAGEPEHAATFADSLYIVSNALTIQDTGPNDNVTLLCASFGIKSELTLSVGTTVPHQISTIFVVLFCLKCFAQLLLPFIKRSTDPTYIQKNTRIFH